MPRPKPHVYITRNLRGKWVIRLTGQYRTQEMAEVVGRGIAGLLDLQFEIRDRLGRIRKADSSGNAPDRPDIRG